MKDISIILNGAVSGAHKVVGLAEGILDKALTAKGETQAVSFFYND